jgi:hypothetical protein
MPSPLNSVSSAIECTKRILFSPFQAKKWFVLGFSSFLASLGGGFNFNWFRGGKEEFPQVFQDWVGEHLPLVIALAITVFLVLLALGILFLWLSSRGTFMLLDGVVRDRAEIREPWHRFKSQGNQLFVFQLLAGLAALGILLPLAAVGVGLPVWLLSLGSARIPMLYPIVLLVAGGLLVLAASFAVLLFFGVLHDFAVPIMFQQGHSPREALRIFRIELLPRHLGGFALFYLLKVGLGIASGVLVLLAGCLTCCIGFLPYLSSVLTLPVAVFFRAYSLDFLRQVDPGRDLLGGHGEGSLPEEGQGQLG